MADFTVPFAVDGDRRFATPTEQQEGFPCGPAERALFNGEFYRVEAEIGEVIRYAGIVGSNDRMTQLREAINNLIAAAIGVIPSPPDVTGFVLMSQARARFPIFPHIYGGYITPVSPGVGVCRVPGGIYLPASRHLPDHDGAAGSQHRREPDLSSALAAGGRSGHHAKWRVQAL